VQACVCRVSYEVLCLSCARRASTGHILLGHACNSLPHYYLVRYSLHPTRQASGNMLRVLPLAIVGCLSLSVAFSPLRPVYTLDAAKSKCQDPQTHVNPLLHSTGVWSETLHVRHAVSTTSGSYSDESAGVRWQAEWPWWGV
jgi:hypothetical protein